MEAFSVSIEHVRTIGVEGFAPEQNDVRVNEFPLFEFNAFLFDSDSKCNTDCKCRFLISNGTQRRD